MLSFSILLDVPSSISSEKLKINIVSDIAEYTSAQSFILQVPYDNLGQTLITNMTCTPTDTGIQESSFMLCQIIYPINIGVAEQKVIASVEAYNNLKDGYEKQIEILNLQKMSEQGLKDLLLGGIILSAIVLILNMGISKLKLRIGGA